MLEAAASAAPDWLTPAQKRRYDQAAAHLGRPVRAGIDESLLCTFVLAQEQYETAAGQQSALDGKATAPLLTKGSGGRAAASPYLSVMERAARQMARAAQQLGFRATTIPGPFGPDPDEQGVGAAFPLPAPLADDPEGEGETGDVSTVSKRELAMILRITRPTLDAWIDRFGAAFPILERGTQGRGYRFEPLAVMEFLRGRQEENAQRKADRDEQLAQLLLPLQEAPQAPGASLEDQIKAERLNVIRLENARKSGALVAVAEVEAEQMAFMSSLSRNLQAWGRQFGRTKGWPEGLVREIEASLGALQRATVREHMNSSRQEAEPEQELAFG